ncbi:hypothetical protein NV379_03250 [Paenibacillus sp. N1-5-1-14]|uniref:hypothetical protein n=1 Tax=Paenibacillus radicibacter TaxID=2972488 RepID=UPI002158D85E|nr:hypothetical protein [Paenibacillus radicibacter]MCR8641664.1 hypothetical protein [Paenibacillus radicibacter]
MDLQVAYKVKVNNKFVDKVVDLTEVGGSNPVEFYHHALAKIVVIENVPEEHVKIVSIG